MPYAVNIAFVSSKKVLLQLIFIIQLADVKFFQDLGATANFTHLHQVELHEFALTCPCCITSIMSRLELNTMCLPYRLDSRWVEWGVSCRGRDRWGMGDKVIVLLVWDRCEHCSSRIDPEQFKTSQRHQICGIASAHAITSRGARVCN